MLVAAEIKRHFPKAKFVPTARDPRDNLVSLFKRHEPKEKAKSVPRTSTAQKLTEFVAMHGAASLEVERSFPNDTYAIRLEDVQANCIEVMRRLATWLGLGPMDEARQCKGRRVRDGRSKGGNGINHHEPQEGQMSHIQLRHFLMEQAVSKRSQGLWRKALSRGEVDDIQSEPRLVRYMKRFGYMHMRREELYTGHAKRGVFVTSK